EGGIDRRIDDEHIRAWTVGDPHLAAVQYERIAIVERAQLHADDVGSGVGLAHRERAEVFTGNQPWEVFLFLLLGTEPSQLVHAQIRMRAVRQSHGRGRATNLFHGDAVCEIAERYTAVLGLYRHPEQTEIAEFRPERTRKNVAAIDLCSDWRDFVLR